MGSPAGSSGTGTGSTANVYTPTGQPAADTQLQSNIYALPSAKDSPAGYYYPKAQSLYSTYFANPTDISLATQGADTAYTYGVGTAYPEATAASGALYGAGSTVLGYGAPAVTAANTTLTTAYDPQNALYKRGQGQALDYSNVASSAAGIGGTPYGASVSGNVLSNYDLNWQDRQLGRQEKALTSYDAAITAAANADLAGASIDTSAANLANAGLSDLTTYSYYPYKTSAAIGSSQLTGINDVVALGNNQYLLPQQQTQDLQSYLGLGQSASQISGSLGATGLSELSSAATGIGSLANTGTSLYKTASGTGSSGSTSSSDTGSSGTYYGGGSDYTTTAATDTSGLSSAGSSAGTDFGYATTAATDASSAAGAASLTSYLPALGS